jgi:hypothetical protein
MADEEGGGEQSQPPIKAIRSAVSELSETEGEDPRKELVREKRQVIRNQVSVLVHQRDLAFSALRLNVAVLFFVFVFLTSVLVFQRDELGETIEYISAASDVTSGNLFFLATLFLTGTFLYYLVIYSYRFMINAELIQSENSNWRLNTTEELDGIDTEELLENQNEIIEDNAERIQENESRITEITEDSVNLVTALSVTFLTVVFLWVVSSLAFVPGVAVGALAVVVGASGITFAKIVLDHYV